MNRIAIFAILIVLLTGCVRTNAVQRASTTNIDDAAIENLAAQTAKRLATHYPPGRTTLYLEQEKTPFLQLLEDNLRSQGFLFNATAGGKNALNLHARLDSIQGEAQDHWYLYVRLSDGFSFGKLYTVNEEGYFIPVGVLSQTPAFFQLVDSGGDSDISPVTAKSETWQIHPGKLKPQMDVWASRAGYHLVWNCSHDFRMHTDVVFNDTFTGAVKRLFAGMQKSGNALKVLIYTSNKTIEVSEQ